MQELSNIEPYCQKIFNKSKTKIFGEIWVRFSIVGKPLDQGDFLEVIFIIFRPKLGGEERHVEI